VERTGEQQQRQHPLHEDVREIDRAKQRSLVLQQALRDAHCVEPGERQGHGQRAGHDTDRRGHPDESVIQIGEQRGDDEADGSDVEHGSVSAERDRKRAYSAAHDARARGLPATHRTAGEFRTLTAR